MDHPGWKDKEYRSKNLYSFNCVQAFIKSNFYSLKVYTYVFSGLPISNLNYENKEVFPYDLRLNEFTSLVLCTFPILVCGVHTPI